MKLTTETEIFYQRLKPFVSRDDLLRTGIKRMNSGGSLEMWPESEFFRAVMGSEVRKASDEKDFSSNSARKVYFMHIDDDPTEPHDRYITNTSLAKIGYLGTTQVAYSGDLDDARSWRRMYLASIDAPNTLPGFNKYYPYI